MDVVVVVDDVDCDVKFEVVWLCDYLWLWLCGLEFCVYV